MKKQVSLHLSKKASDKLTQLSNQLGISCDEFATLCFEYVDVKHQGIVAAAEKIREKKSKATANKKNLSQHLKQLSTEQVELLLSKAAQKKKN